MGDGSGRGGDAPLPGWYPDPETPGLQRWWDGRTWTDHRGPMETGGTGWSTGAGTPAAGGSPAGGAAGGPAPPEGWGAGSGGPAHGVPVGPASAPYVGVPTTPIDTWLWQSIVATILCCQPFGIAAIVFSAQAQAAINVGDRVNAEQKARQARTFTLVSAGLAVALWVGVFLWFGLITSRVLSGW